MANEDHLRILKEGVEAWNQWRKQHPEVIPDLESAELREAQLGEIPPLPGPPGPSGSARTLHVLRKYEAFVLSPGGGVNLSQTKIRYAMLEGANLLRADFRNADLSGSFLAYANLREADLRGADLCGAILNYANLSGSHLRETNLSNCRLGWTDLGNIDLSAVKGLERIRHEGPSAIGIDTIYRSAGKIPVIFLRGVGVPDNFIQYMHSLTGRAFDYYSCFISYASKDQVFADRLYADLQAKGVRCWFASEDLKIGDKFRQSIDDAIRVHDKLLVVLSEPSVSSTWVEEEVEAALARERKENKLVLFPVRLDNAVMNTDKAWAATLQRMRQIGDFCNWQDHNSYQKSFQRLLRDLKGDKGQGASVTGGDCNFEIEFFNDSGDDQ